MTGTGVAAAPTEPDALPTTSDCAWTLKLNVAVAAINKDLIVCTEYRVIASPLEKKNSQIVGTKLTPTHTRIYAKAAKNAAAKKIRFKAHLLWRNAFVGVCLC